MRKNILVTGRPGIGKTTVIEKVVESVGRAKVGGFWSRELRESGKRVGFAIETFSGKTGVLAHCNIKSGPRIGKYIVNIRDIDDIAIPSIAQARKSDKLIIIDEIASMELCSPLFEPEVLKCLDTRRVLGSIQQRHSRFLSSIRERTDTELLEITLSNRDNMPQIVYSKLGLSTITSS